MLDMYHATRDDLIRIILEQRDALADRDRQLAALREDQAELRRVLAQLTAQIGAQSPPAADDAPTRSTPTGMPGLKPTESGVPHPRTRKQRAHGAGRSRMEATVQVAHALATCPDCGCPLAGGTVKRTREVIDLPWPTVEVTEHVYLERRCPACGKRCVPPPEVTGLVHGQGRIGHGLTSLIAVLREEVRLPVGTIQTLLATLTGLHLSVGAIVGAIHQVAHRAMPVVAQVQEAIRASPVVHADETGWREDGHNGYVWTFSTPTQRLFLHGGRDKQMLARGLGDAFGGVLVSDFYGVYTGNPGIHQFCWAHLLRDLHDLTTDHLDDDAVCGWAEAVQAVFARAQAGAQGSREQRWVVREQVTADLRQLCVPGIAPRVPQTRLCARILRSLQSLFVFVTEPAVPATNNAAERSLRHLVVSRKISGGTRSPCGTTTKMTLASLFGSWRAQGINPYLACRDLLVSPQL